MLFPCRCVSINVSGRLFIMITNLEQGEDIRLEKRNKGSENYSETKEKGKRVRVNKDRKKRRKLKRNKT
jgi:hypothetical protein